MNSHHQNRERLHAARGCCAPRLGVCRPVSGRRKYRRDNAEPGRPHPDRLNISPFRGLADASKRLSLNTESASSASSPTMSGQRFIPDRHASRPGCRRAGAFKGPIAAWRRRAPLRYPQAGRRGVHSRRLCGDQRHVRRSAPNAARRLSFTDQYSRRGRPRTGDKPRPMRCSSRWRRRRIASELKSKRLGGMTVGFVHFLRKDPFPQMPAMHLILVYWNIYDASNRQDNLAFATYYSVGKTKEVPGGAFWAD